MENYCTNCGSTLNYQPGYDPTLQYWKCTDCGTMLISPDVDDSSCMYPGVVWVCDECGAILNNQIGFSDYLSEWTCDECGHVNKIDSSEIDSNNTDADISLGTVIGEAMVAFAAAKIAKGINNARAKKTQNQDEEEDKEDLPNEQCVKTEKFSDLIEPEHAEKDTKTLTILIVALLILAFGVFGFTKLKELIPAGYSYEECINMDYAEVVADFMSSGFESVSAVGLNDLVGADLSQNNLVKSVTIGNKTDFSKKSKFSYHSVVNVFYHSPKVITPTMASKDFSGMDYNEAKQVLLDAGFYYIDLISKEDLIFGVLSKENTVESVTINDTSKFKSDTEFASNAKVVITYHLFKPKK